MDIDNCVLIKIGYGEYIVEREVALKAFDVLSRLDLTYCLDTTWDEGASKSKPYIKFNPLEISLSPLNKSEYVKAASHPKSDSIS